MLDINREMGKAMAGLNQMGLSAAEAYENGEHEKGDILKRDMDSLQLKLIFLAILHLSSSVNAIAEAKIRNSLRNN